MTPMTEDMVARLTREQKKLVRRHGRELEKMKNARQVLINIEARMRVVEKTLQIVRSRKN